MPTTDTNPKPLGKPLLTTQQIGCLRFSPCGKLLAAGDYDASVQRWSISDAGLSPLPPLAGKHNGWVDALTFAPKGELLFTADTWGRLSCWDYAAWVGETPPQAEAVKPRWSRDDAHDGYIRQIAVSPDGNHLATCGRDQTIRIWSLDGQLKHELKDHREDVYGLAFSPDSTAMVSGDLKGVIRVWSTGDFKMQRTMDASSLYLLHRIQDVGGARVLAFSTDGKSLFCGGALPKTGGFVEASPRLLRFDFADGKLEQDLTLGDPAHGFIYDMHQNAAGHLMMVLSGQPGQGRLMLLKPGEDKPFFTDTSMPNCHALAPHPDGRRFAIASTNGGSNANGRPGALKNGVYTGNHSPIHLWSLPA